MNNVDPVAWLTQNARAHCPEIYAEYLARLDAPTQPNERLARTMTTKAPWDKA